MWILDFQDASSVVSLVCGTSKIAWAHVNRGMMVQDWQQVDCPNFLKGTYMASAYLHDVRTAAVAFPLENDPGMFTAPVDSRGLA